MTASLGDALLDAFLDFLVDVCTIVAAAFVGFGLAWNEGKELMLYLALAMIFLVAALIFRIIKNTSKRARHWAIHIGPGI
jgi:CHASE2 domain-containing sensor protein